MKIYDNTHESFSAFSTKASAASGLKAFTAEIPEKKRR